MEVTGSGETSPAVGEIECDKDTTINITAALADETASVVVGSSDIYTVTFNNTTDTEADPQTMEVIEGQSLDALPAEPNKDLHIFKECNTVEDGTGDIFTANTPVNTDITVFAQWERIVIENLSITASGPNPVYTENRIVLETTLNIMGTGNTPISYSEVVANYNLD